MDGQTVAKAENLSNSSNSCIIPRACIYTSKGNEIKICTESDDFQSVKPAVVLLLHRNCLHVLVHVHELSCFRSFLTSSRKLFLDSIELNIVGIIGLDIGVDTIQSVLQSFFG